MCKNSSFFVYLALKLIYIMIRSYFTLLLFLIATTLPAQKSEYVKSIVKELSSDHYLGRGYIGKGDSIAADFIASEFKRFGVKRLGESYFQPYSFSINTYPKASKLTVGGKSLKTIEQFLVYPTTETVKGEFKLEWIDADMIDSGAGLEAFLAKDHSNSFIAIDSTGVKSKEAYKLMNNLLVLNTFKAKGVLEINSKLLGRARKSVVDYARIQVLPNLITPKDSVLSVDIYNEFIEDYKTQNVVGYVEGKTDSTIIFVAHYDHLGIVDGEIFPGAHDNASGTAFVMDFAKHYRKGKKPKYNMVFLLVSGEESGLNGSTYFVNNPLVDLETVKLVFNFDMVASGEEGIILINGKNCPEFPSFVEEVNGDKSYSELPITPTEGGSGGSDHAPFYKKGIDAIFFYTMGKSGGYHKVTDVYSDELTFEAHDTIHRLITDYLKR